MANLPNFGSIKTSLGKLCLPSKIYLAISIIVLLIATFNSFSIITILVKIIFIAVWTFILNWICKKGYTTISWVLVIFPYVLFILMLLTGKDGSDKKVNKPEEEKDMSDNSVKQLPSYNIQPTAIIKEKVDSSNITQVPSFTESEVYSKENRKYLAY